MTREDQELIEQWGDAVAEARRMVGITRPDQESVDALLHNTVDAPPPMQTALDIAAGLVHPPDRVKRLAAAYLALLAALARHRDAEHEIHSHPRPW